MQMCIQVGIVVVALAAAAQAQIPVAFVDVPPWHWAFEDVERGASTGIFRGYPIDDRERVVNAVTQVYDSFVHASHPRAGEWSARFLVNLPSHWPQPLERFRLVSFRLENVQADLRSDRGAVSFVATITQRTPAGTSEMRTPMRVEVRKDAEGRWRVHYPDLAAGQPQVFR